MTEEEKLRAANSTAADAVGGTAEELDPFEAANIANSDLRGADPTDENVEVDYETYAEIARQENEDLAGPAPTEQDVIESGSGVTEDPKPAPTKNPLHDYATSTYGITLFLLTEKDYNTLVTNPQNWSPSNALISSAGNYKGVKRNPEFRDDFYFDNLKLDTVIGLNANTRGTNAIDISFTVIEPYGMTLLDRVINAATAAGSKNYLKQPYLLQIDFFGSKSLGDMQSPIPYLTKRIPIMLLEMKIKSGVKGTEYAIRAVPFNHGAFLATTNSTPANFEVKATTVRDFFEEAGGASVVEQKKSREAERQQLQQERLGVDYGEFTTAEDVKRVDARQADFNKRASASYKAESYAGAWNAWNQDLADKKNVSIANRIKFVIDDEIADSKIVDDRAPIDRTPYSQVGTTATKSGQQGNNAEISKATPAGGFDPSKMIFNISAGSSVVDVINLVMRNSEYIKNQVSDPLQREQAKANTPVDFFKITSSVKIIGFDTKRNEYAKETTYYIKKYKYYNSKTPNMSKSTPPGAVKRYDYIYTGKNIDILDFSIDFDTAFYTTMIANRQNIESLSSQPDAGDELSSNAPATAPTGRGSLVPNSHTYVANDMTATSTGADSAKAVLVANSMKTIYSSSRGDMLQVKLKILGDPHFIKQDEVYTNPGGETTYSVMLNAGTLTMDRGEIFCIINFVTPTDMDSVTGLTRTDGRYIRSGFSGYYKILRVDNEFSRGQFAQTLDCIRVFDIPEINERPLSDSEVDDELNKQWIASNPQMYDEDTAPTDADVNAALDEDLARQSPVDDYPETDPQIDVSESEAAELQANLGDAPTVDISQAI